MERFATELEYQNSSKDKVSYVVESDTVHYPAANPDPYPWKIIWTGYIPSGGYDENRTAWKGGSVTDEKLIQYPLDFFDDGPNFFTTSVAQRLREIVIPKIPENENSYFLSGAEKIRRIELGDGWKNSILTPYFLNGAGYMGHEFSSRLDIIFPKEIKEVYFNGLISTCVFPEVCDIFTVPGFRNPESSYVTIPKGVKNVVCSSNTCKELKLTGNTTTLTLEFTNLSYLTRLIIDGEVTTINCTGQTYSNITEIIIRSTTMPTTSPVIAKTIGEHYWWDYNKAKRGKLMVPKSQTDNYRSRILDPTPYLIDPNDLSNWEIIGI